MIERQEYIDTIEMLKGTGDAYAEAIAEIVLKIGNKVKEAVEKGIDPVAALIHYDAEWCGICDEIGEKGFYSLLKMHVDRMWSSDEERELQSQELDELISGVDGE